MKTKYVVTSGFLGAGKTTSMIAFAKNINERKLGTAGILVDDLGATNIVDASTTETSGVITLDISGDCICYQHENLVDKLHQLEVLGSDVIFSDIPGLGIGALDNVYLQLEEREPGEFDLMPFLCIIDPERIRMVMPEQADLNLPDELKFLLNAQMAEADLIVLNKIDTISEEKKDEILAFVKERYPDTPALAMSAVTGEGVDQVVDHLLNNTAAAKHREIGYGSEEFMAAESLLCWYNRRSFFEQRDGKNIDFNQVITDLFEEIKKGLKAKGANVPHLKMFASDGAEQNADVFKASLIGVDYEVEYDSKLQNEYTALSLIINARAAAKAEDMADVVEDAVDAVSQKYDLKVRTYFVESFGMMDEGRGNTGRASKY